MATVRRWSGAEAAALRAALRFSVRGFAAHLGIAPRTVSKWESRGASTFPLPDTQAMLDTVLARADADAQQRFEMLCTPALDGATAGAHSPSVTNSSAALGHGEFDRSDVKPVEYFTFARRVLVDNDNMFGPGSAVAQVDNELSAIEVSCARAAGVDLVELLHARTRFAEFRAWLHQDLGEHAVAMRWIDRASDWATTHDQVELAAYILARKAQLACDMRRSSDGAQLGEAAIKAAPTARLQAIASTYAAHACAVAGDERRSGLLYESARDLAGRAKLQEEPGLGMWLDDSYIDIHQACSYRELGRHDESAVLFSRAVDHLTPAYHRDRGVYLARAANAYALTGDLDRAIATGERALRINSQTGSSRTADELDVLASFLALRRCHLVGSSPRDSSISIQRTDDEESCRGRTQC